MPKLAEVKLTVTPLTVEFAMPRGHQPVRSDQGARPGEWQVGLTVQDFSAGRVKLIKISPKGEGELREQINASPKVLQNLIDFGGKARVVEDVLIAVEAKLFDPFSADLDQQRSGHRRGPAGAGGTLGQLGHDPCWKSVQAPSSAIALLRTEVGAHRTRTRPE